nr:MAG TPA: hypothetical protein [Caudoviricetes sp.]
MQPPQPSSFGTLENFCQSICGYLPGSVLPHH